MTLMINLYPKHGEYVFAKSKRNLDLKIKRFCIEHENVARRAIIMVHRDLNCKSMRNWCPGGHILLIHNSDYDKWAGIIKKKFKDFEMHIEQVIKYE